MEQPSAKNVRTQKRQEIALYLATAIATRVVDAFGALQALGHVPAITIAEEALRDVAVELEMLKAFVTQEDKTP